MKPCVRCIHYARHVDDYCTRGNEIDLVYGNAVLDKDKKCRTERYAGECGIEGQFFLDKLVGNALGHQIETSIHRVFKTADLTLNRHGLNKGAKQCSVPLGEAGNELPINLGDGGPHVAANHSSSIDSGLVGS